MPIEKYACSCQQESVEPSPDGGNYMAVSNLRSLHDHSRMLLAKIDHSTPLPDWIEAKLTKAATHLLDVTEWVEHGSSLRKKASRFNWKYNPIAGATFADTPMGTYTLWPAGRGIECRWNNKPVGFIQSQDLDSAKNACQAHYVSGVFPKNQNLSLYASKRL